MYISDINILQRHVRRFKKTQLFIDLTDLDSFDL